MRLWHYFLTLERDFAATAAFVEPHRTNYQTFSDRYAGLILLIGSEVDVVAKQLVAKVDASAPSENIEDYRNTLSQRYPNLHSLEVSLPRYDLKSRPWANWGANPPSSPDWWKAYNKVKHDRTANLDCASQINALDGLCGLLLLNLYLNGNPASLWPYPELIGGEYFPPVIVDQPDATLPDI
jgi:hypothetical protein